jgi:hypothetical protein
MFIGIVLFVVGGLISSHRHVSSVQIWADKILLHPGDKNKSASLPLPKSFGVHAEIRDTCSDVQNTIGHSHGKRAEEIQPGSEEAQEDSG